MLKKLIENVFGSKKKRDVELLKPIVKEINEFFEEYKSLSDEDLREKTNEFRGRINKAISEDEAKLAQQREELKKDLSSNEREIILEDITDLEKNIYETIQEVLAEILPEAFAVVKETCRRHVGKEWESSGGIIKWDMVHYDVQLIGGIVLHQGKIAEMATGEGKTLVATLPTYLNAIAGKGLHIITVNDYLAKRDSEWMGPIYEYLGLKVGCIQSNMRPEQRKKEYDCDITFGTNNEFGFDYLRDNMVSDVKDMVQRGYNYAIVDEVDSVLIDEARTPLIISGPVGTSNDDAFVQMRARVDRLVSLQTKEVATMVAEAEKLIHSTDKKEVEQAGIYLFRARRGAPKSNKLSKMLQDPAARRLVEITENDFLRDKQARMHEIDDELYYSIDEKNHSIDMSDKGRHAIASGGEDIEMFTLPDLATELSMLEGSDESKEDKQIKRDKLMMQYSERSERVHIVSQLLRAYSLYEKDVEYVVQDNKIKIVDTFTGRILEGRRYSEGLHQAIEAKESVTVQEDTQTFATVTIQNYFRLYKKLAGMTGTAETEEGEFGEIYKLDVVVIPTNRDISRKDSNDLILRTKRAKYLAVIDKVQECRSKGQPVLVGTTNVEVSETISRMLRMSQIPHSVLNAKQHQKEAEIVTAAGQKGSVTIATNMAGRGTDIKLGPGVKEAGGLFILGTERHESRRIDRQLRGRAGRQGDPGASQFFISLEDDLMRLFGGDRITSIMERFGAAEETLESPMLNKSVERAQKKVEENNFAIRKRLLEYDNVMNQQREVIYDRRRHALFGERLKGEILEYVEEFVEDLIDAHFPDSISILRDELRTRLLIDIEITDDQAKNLSKDKLKEGIIEIAHNFYHRKEEQLGLDYMVQLEKYAVLNTIDDRWREHLREMDDMKEGIYLRAYGQKDPLLEYKKEAFILFSQMIGDINLEVIATAFKYFPESQSNEDRKRAEDAQRLTIQKALNNNRKNVTSGAQLQFTHANTTGLGMIANSDDIDSTVITANTIDQQKKTFVRDEKKIGRNDTCFCGSGKKYKNCHGRE
ncbi:MAG: preprotein translocase subunit SecA [Chlorobiota bacterium]|jgi:preprotein translocase subunit SecA|nr:MAG: preprotein translocase subunit SecA [Chlorobiota bacterium]